MHYYICIITFFLGGASGTIKQTPLTKIVVGGAQTREERVALPLFLSGKCLAGCIVDCAARMDNRDSSSPRCITPAPSPC